MSDLVKYPRTMNLPWSESNSSDDVWWTDTDVERNFGGKRVVISEKYDGENTNLYRNHYHARSLETGVHPSQDWIKRLHGQVKHDIPVGTRVCGENCYAYHSIFYTHLPTYFFVFGIYNQDNVCLSWNETVEWAELLGLSTVSVIYRGVWDEKLCRSLWSGKGAFPTFACDDKYPVYPNNFYPVAAEGYVIRLEDSFCYDDFECCVAKYVGKGFRSTIRDVHWASTSVVPNLLALRDKNASS